MTEIFLWFWNRDLLKTWPFETALYLETGNRPMPNWSWDITRWQHNARLTKSTADSVTVFLSLDVKTIGVQVVGIMGNVGARFRQGRRKHIDYRWFKLSTASPTMLLKCNAKSVQYSFNIDQQVNLLHCPLLTWFKHLLICGVHFINNKYSSTMLHFVTIQQGFVCLPSIPLSWFREVAAFPWAPYVSLSLQFKYSLD